MSTWARDFLDEDSNDMGDPSYFFIKMTQQAREDLQRTNTGDDMQFNAIERQLTPDPDDCPGGCGWPAISCKCAELANVFQDSIARPELTLDESLLRHILHTATWDELKLRERLANDPIAAFMRTVKCREYGCPVTDCQCKKAKPVESWI